MFVVDSATDADLVRTVEVLTGRLGHCLLVGSAGIAGAVAQVCLPQQRVPEQPRAAGQVGGVAIGTRAEQSTQQAAALAVEPGVEVFPAPNGEVDTGALLDSGADTLVLRASAGADGREGDAEQVAAMLARNTVRVLRTCRSMPWLPPAATPPWRSWTLWGDARCRSWASFSRASPIAGSSSTAQRLWLVTKAGGFGSRDTLVMVRRLRGQG